MTSDYKLIVFVSFIISTRNFKYLCITSDPKVKINKDLKTEGRYRDINMTISPFFLKNCKKIIKVPVHENENYVDLNVYDSDIK